MNRRTKWIGVILCLVVIVALSAWPLWKWLGVKPVSASLFEKTKALVEKNPQLRPAWNKAMEDGVLTWPETKEIWDQAGQKVEPEE